MTWDYAASLWYPICASTSIYWQSTHDRTGYGFIALPYYRPCWLIIESCYSIHLWQRQRYAWEGIIPHSCHGHWRLILFTFHLLFTFMLHCASKMVDNYIVYSCHTYVIDSGIVYPKEPCVRNCATHDAALTQAFGMSAVITRCYWIKTLGWWWCWMRLLVRMWIAVNNRNRSCGIKYHLSIQIRHVLQVIDVALCLWLISFWCKRHGCWCILFDWLTDNAFS